MNDSERINNSYTERKVHPFFSVHKNITAFFDYIKATPFDQLCEKYVNTFDYHGVVTLHLTYNVFKDSRKRGEALIELQRLYKTIDMEKTSSKSEEHTSELQSRGQIVCRLLLEKKNIKTMKPEAPV